MTVFSHCWESMVLVRSGMPGQPVPAHCPAWHIPYSPLREAGKPEVLSDVLIALYFTSGRSSHLQNGVTRVTLRSELILGLFPALDEGLKPPWPVLMLEWSGSTSAPSCCEEKGGRWGRGQMSAPRQEGDVSLGCSTSAPCWKPLWNCTNKALQLPLERGFSTSTALCGWEAHSYRKGWQDWSQVCRRWFPESICSSLPFFFFSSV